VVVPDRKGLSPTLYARPWSLLSEKSPEKRSFFSVQRYRLTVGDKPFLPGTLSAVGHYVSFRLDLTSFSCTIVQRCESIQAQ